MLEAERLSGRTVPPSGFRYTSIAAFVQANAQHSCGRKMTPGERHLVRRAKEACERVWGEPKPKECYANAQKLVLTAHDERVVYAEGYAIHAGGFLPVMHAWVELDEAIIDPTPIWKDQGLGVFSDGYCYHAAIRKSYQEIAKRIAERESMDAYIDDWRCGFPLLREN